MLTISGNSPRCKHPVFEGKNKKEAPPEMPRVRFPDHEKALGDIVLVSRPGRDGLIRDMEEKTGKPDKHRAGRIIIIA